MAQDQNAKKKKIKNYKRLSHVSLPMLLNRSKQHLVKMLDKIELDDIKPSSRKYPFINFQIGREIGNDVLTVDGLTASHEGETLFKDMRFSMNKEDKIVLLGSPMAKTALLDILMEEKKRMLAHLNGGNDISKLLRKRS